MDKGHDQTNRHHHQEADAHAVDVRDVRGARVPHAPRAKRGSDPQLDRAVEQGIRENPQPAEVARGARRKEAEEEDAQDAGADEALELLDELEDATELRIA